MLRRSYSSLLVLGLALAQPALAEPVGQPDASNVFSKRAVLAATQYAQAQDFELPALSPDGQRVAHVGISHGQRVVVIRRLDDQAQPVVVSTPEGEPQRVFWKTAQRLVAVIALAERRGRDGLLTRETRLIAFDADGRQLKGLIQSEHYDYIPQFQDHIVSTLPNDGSHILVALPAIDGLFRSELRNARLRDDRIRYPDVREVDVRDGSSRVVQTRTEGIRDWWADADGQVRVGTDFNAKGEARLIYRRPGESNWRTLAIQLADSGLQPGSIAVQSMSSQDGDALLVRGRDASGVAWRRLSLPGGSWLPYAPPAQIHWSGESTVLGTPKAWGALKADLALVTRALGGSAVVWSASNDLSTQLVQTKRAYLPDQWWLLTHPPHAPADLSLLSDNLGDLEAKATGTTRQVRIPTRDGQSIPALLTLPGAGPADGVKLPLLIWLHDGPALPVTDRFDPQVAFVSSQGWAVLRPLYRGTAGLTAGHQEAGRGQWGKRMQDDVSDSAHWAMQQAGIDPKRIVVSGAGYGGYSALLALADEPTLYQAGVAIAPVTDLPAFRTQLHSYLDFDMGRVLMLDDDVLTHAPSPTEVAAHIRAPVLLVHGRQDTRVAPVQTELMDRALNRAQVAHRVLWLPQAGHDIDVPGDRAQTYLAISDFLSSQPIATSGASNAP